MVQFLKLEKLSKSYGKLAVLKSLSLVVQQSEFVVILGESGSGKSTLLRLIAGLEPSSSGSIHLKGVDQKNVPPHKRSIGIVFQNGNGYDHLNVRENLELAVKTNLNLVGSPRAELERWIELTQLGPLLGQKLSQLSGGQQQRVALARAYLSGKSLILMDEPLSSLDHLHRNDLRTVILQKHRENQQTAIYVTHDSDEAMILADRIALLSEGQIVQAGPTRNVYLSPISLQAGKQLGRLRMDSIELPTGWLENRNQGGSQTQNMTCGVRPHDWTLTSIHFSNKSYAVPTKSGFQFEGPRTQFENSQSAELVRATNSLWPAACSDGHGIERSGNGELLLVCGRVIQVVWLGDSWLMKIKVLHYEMEISVLTNGLDIELDGILEKICTLSSLRETVEAFVSATIPLKRVSVFPFSEG